MAPAEAPRRRSLGLFAGAVAFLLGVVFSPSVFASFWSPAAALVLVVAAVGLPRLLVLLRGPERGAASAALVFLGIAVVSAALSANPVVGFFGLYDWGTGALFVAGLVGAWAVGRSLGIDGRRLVERGLLAAVIVNAGIAMLEAAVDLSAFHLGRFDARSPGLLGNPVHVGALLAGGVALLAPRVERRPAAWAGAVVAVGAGLQVAGARSALAIALVVALAAAARRGRRTITVLVLGLVAGVVVGAGLTHVGGGVNTTSRVQEASGLTPRVASWSSTRHAIVRHPLLGTGPGQFRAATSRFRTVAIARAETPDRLYVDAHNLVVEYATTTGLLGLAALLAWLLLASRRASGPLLGFALAVLAAHLLEPQSVRTTPMALLALGAAGPTLAIAPLRRVGRAATAMLAALALAGGARLLAGDFHLNQANLDFSEAHARAALDLLPRWPEPAAVMGRIHLFEAKTRRDPAELDEAWRWQREAVRRDPSDPILWLVLGNSELSADRYHEAAAAYAAVLTRNPVSTEAMNSLGFVAVAQHHRAEARRWFRRSLAVLPDQPTIRRRLQG